jgi:YD repeat-containing protein
MTDRDRWDLRGPVHTCRLERTLYVRRCGADACETDERSDTAIVEFRADGAIARRTHINQDGSEWTSTHEHDPVGRLIHVRNANSSGPVSSQHYNYDSRGRLIRVIERKPDGRERIAEDHEYDDAGLKKKTQHVDDTLCDRGSFGWAIEGTDSIYSAAGATSLTTSDNAHGQPAELVLRNSAGRVLSRVEFAYDAAGHLISEEQTNLADLLPAEKLTEMTPAKAAAVHDLLSAGTTRQHRYDDRGRRIETHSPMGELGWSRYTMAYNERGDKIEQVSEDDSRAGDIDDEGRFIENRAEARMHRSEARFRYEYDSHGNWLTKVVEGRSGGDGEFEVSSRERRGLTYF